MDARSAVRLEAETDVVFFNAVSYVLLNFHVLHAVHLDHEEMAHATSWHLEPQLSMESFSGEGD